MKMEIKFKDFDKEELIKFKELIDKILNEDLEDMELTEENLIKAEKIVNLINSIRSKQVLSSSAHIKIVSSDGTELTTMY